MITKRQASDLAINGGRPAFGEPLHVGRPNIGDKQQYLRMIGEMLERRWLGFPTRRSASICSRSARPARMPVMTA